ncbi:hypothetical protein DPMN_050663 [Dreissena polymorpha]|uniref:Uncharacterized protein n=1 Tax=Dreissena polymorpha TaxID=45954 RepID=A0A9D4CIH7_DREPO|nr:hypothetical protein DPMN_050663 [Dreissena polymorpha]
MNDTAEQLIRFQQFNGTFHVDHKPFYQLLFVHALLRHEDSLKQMPLHFIMTSPKMTDLSPYFHHIVCM